MKLERLGSGQYLCTMPWDEANEMGLHRSDPQIEIKQKLQKIAEDVIDDIVEEYGEGALNEDGRTVITCLENSIYFGVMADKEKYQGAHMNEIKKAIQYRETHHEEEAYHIDGDNILPCNSIEVFDDEMPDPITELRLAAVSFKRIGEMMNFLKANAHLSYILSYAYKDNDGHYIFALKGPDEDILSMMVTKAVEFGARAIKNPPAIEYMNEHYKKLSVSALASIG